MYDPKDELTTLPEMPGVYLMRDGKDMVIYVGKAVNIKNRFRSYFQASNAHIPKIIGIRTNMKSFEYIVVENEVEAFILECNLIKTHRPRYNIVMKDDKAYPYIKFTGNELFPRAFLSRAKETQNDGTYFGPYINPNAVMEVLDLLFKIWPLRRCKKTITAPDTAMRPCLYHHIGQCKAPCAGLINEADYCEMVSEFMKFLNGKHDELLISLNDEMAKAAEELNFEKAAAMRDKIRSVKLLKVRQNMSVVKRGDTDIVAYAANETEALAQVFFVREGKIIGREHHLLEGIESMSEDELMAAFLAQFYSGTPFVPKEIVIHKAAADVGVIEEWLSGVKGSKVTLHVPQKGEKLKLAEMAYQNALLQLKQFGEKIKAETRRTTGAVIEVLEALGVEVESDRIEAYDISNTQGTDSVASMVVFEQGKPKRSDYRKFKIRTVKGPNDFAAMEEVLTRRFNRYELEKTESEAKRKFSKLPNLIFVDGGKPQISAAEGVLERLGFNIPVCGMVKDDKHRTKGLMFNGEEVTMPRHSEGFKLLTRIQDEVHRFAIEYHKTLRQKASVRSVLDDIPGVGQARRVSLVKHFGSVEKIKSATVDELAAADSMNVKAAQAVWEFFNEENEKITE